MIESDEIEILERSASRLREVGSDDLDDLAEFIEGAAERARELEANE